MSTLGLIYGWIAFALVAHVLFHIWARRIAPGHGWFGRFMPMRAALAVHGIATACWYLVPSRMLSIVQPVHSALLVVAAFAMARATQNTLGLRPWWCRFATVVLVAVVLTALAGGMGRDGAPLSTFDAALLAIGWVPFVVSAVRLVLALGFDVAPGLGGLFGALAGFHDIGVRAGWLHTPMFLDFVGLFIALTIAIRLGGTVSSARTALADKQRALERNVRELEASRAELERKRALAQSGEFAAIVAHEVRNPLAIIRNVGSRLADPGRSAADRASLLAIVQEEVARLDDLVVDLTRFTTPLLPDREPVDVRELLESVADRERSARDGDPRVTFDVDCEAALPRLYADPELMLMALGNLVANAVHALPQGGRVALSARAASKGDGLILQVVDNGCGMPPEVLRQACQAFFTTRPTGTGLGLTIVQRVVAAHGGELSVESGPEGTTVTLRLPVAHPVEAPAAAGTTALT